MPLKFIDSFLEDSFLQLYTFSGWKSTVDFLKYVLSLFTDKVYCAESGVNTLKCCLSSTEHIRLW